MKKFTSLFITLALVFSARAGLQTDGQFTGGTNNAAANATLAMRAQSSTFTFVNSKSPTFQVRYATSSAANVATNVLGMDCSLDANSWFTNAATINLTNTATTGTNQTFVFTITTLTGPALDAPFWRFGQFANTNATVYYTNLEVKAFSKNGL